MIKWLIVLVLLTGCEQNTEPEISWPPATYCDDEGVKEQLTNFILECVEHPAGGEGDSVRSCERTGKNLFCRKRESMWWIEYKDGLRHVRHEWTED